MLRNMVEQKYLYGYAFVPVNKSHLLCDLLNDVRITKFQSSTQQNCIHYFFRRLWGCSKSFDSVFTAEIREHVSLDKIYKTFFEELTSIHTIRYITLSSFDCLLLLVVKPALQAFSIT